jgi:clan AA aspartic protease (TIGR02281 family)
MAARNRGTKLAAALIGAACLCTPSADATQADVAPYNKTLGIWHVPDTSAADLGHQNRPELLTLVAADDGSHRTSLLRLPAAAPPRLGIVEVQLKRKSSGPYLLPATLNGTTTATFLLDTGASGIVIPTALADRLRDKGSLSDRDFVRNMTYVLANGHRGRDPVYRLRSISVGGVEFHDVECSVSPTADIALLGQSFLERFSRVAIDRSRGVLELTP